LRHSVEGTPYYSTNLRPGPSSSVQIRRETDRQTDRHTHTHTEMAVTNIGLHFASVRKPHVRNVIHIH